MCDKYKEAIDKINSRLDKLLEDSNENKSSIKKYQLYDNQDLLFLTKMSARVLQRHRKNGSLKYINHNGKNYYREEDIRKFIENL